MNPLIQNTATYEFSANATYRKKCPYTTDILIQAGGKNQHGNGDLDADPLSWYIWYDSATSYKYKDANGNPQRVGMTMDIKINKKAKNFGFDDTFYKPHDHNHQTRWQEWNVTIPVDHSKDTVKLPFQYHSMILKKLYGKCILNKTIIIHLSTNWDYLSTAAGQALFQYVKDTILLIIHLIGLV